MNYQPAQQHRGARRISGTTRSRPAAHQHARPATAAGAAQQGHAGRLAAALQGSASGGAGTGSAKRSWFPPSAAGPAAAASATSAAFLQPAAATAIAHAQPHGNLGAFDPRAEASGAAVVSDNSASLPPDRQRQVSTAVRDLRAMPPDQREQVIDSPRFKGAFSDQERDMIRGATHLPLAPAEGGEGGGGPQ